DAGERPLAVEPRIDPGHGGVPEGGELLVARLSEGEPAGPDHIGDPAPLGVADDRGGAEIEPDLALLPPPLGGEQLARRPEPERRDALAVGGREGPVGREPAAALEVVDAVARGPDQRAVRG